MRSAWIIALLVLGCAQAQENQYCRETSVAVSDGGVVLARQWDTVFTQGFDDGLDTWTIENYEGKLSIGVDPDGKNGSCAMVTNEGVEGDTAFELRSAPIPVAGASHFRFQFDWCANRSLTRVAGHRGHYLTLLDWQDDDGATVSPTPFGFGEGDEEWHTRQLSGEVPQGAVSVVIRLGCDHPNITDKEFLRIDNVSLGLRALPARYEAWGSIESRPLRVAAETPSLQWDADTPAQTSLLFRVSAAQDADGAPGTWSEFVGPDGTAGTQYSAPGPLPGTLAERTWVRYMAALETRDPSATPVLKQVRIGSVSDGPWTGVDRTPPVLASRGETRTADPRVPVWFRLTDAVGVDYGTLKMTFDGADVTDRLTWRDGGLVYQPETPLKPRPAETGFGAWRTRNFQNKLAITRTAQRAPDTPRGFHVTRRAGDTDTAFRLDSPVFSVQPGAAYRLSYWSRHTMDLSGAMSTTSGFSGGVFWLDEDGAPVGRRAEIDFGPADPAWHEDAYELTAPEGALNAQIRFGFDIPNIIDGNELDVAELSFEGPRPVRGPSGPNLHEVSLSVADFAGNTLQRDWYMLIRPPRTANVVTIREDGMTLVDGKPFFPIGLYAVWKKEFNGNSFDTAFADMKAAGFNMAHTYASSRTPDFAEFYKAAQRHGIKLYVASASGANCTDVDQVLWDVVREEGKPALLAWYLADDTASHVGADELRCVTEAIHDVDPAHITVQADGVGAPPASRYMAYVGSTDGFLPELYPIRSGTPRDVPQIIQDMQTIRADIERAGGDPKTIWAIVQYFEGWGWPRFPTRDELWAMSYLSIIHGAHGITWYTYGGHGDNHGVTYSAETWSNICGLAGELSELQDTLVQPTGSQPPAPEVLDGPATDALDFPSISILLKEHDGKRVLLAANSADAPVKARFRVGATGTIAVPFEKREFESDGDGFTDSFAPYGVHVYTWTP